MGKLLNTFYVPFKSSVYKCVLWCGLRKGKKPPKRNFDLQQECNLGKYAKFLMAESLSPASLCRPDLLCSEVQCNYCSLACSDVCSEVVPE